MMKIKAQRPPAGGRGSLVRICLVANSPLASEQQPERMYLNVSRQGDTLDAELTGRWRGAELPAIDAELAALSLAGVRAVRVTVPSHAQLDLAGAWRLREWLRGAEKAGATVEFAGGEPGQLTLIESTLSGKVRAIPPSSSEPAFEPVSALGRQVTRRLLSLRAAVNFIGRAVVAQLLDADVPVRALSRRPDAAGLPAAVEVVAGDLSVPESLDAALRGVRSVFLLWTAPPATAPAVIGRLASETPRVVFLSSPHQTPHPFFQQPNSMAVLHADIEQDRQHQDHQRQRDVDSDPKAAATRLLNAFGADKVTGTSM